MVTVVEGVLGSWMMKGLFRVMKSVYTRRRVLVKMFVPSLLCGSDTNLIRHDRNRSYSFRTTPSKDAADGSNMSPSTNLLSLVQLLGEYCLSSGLMLHWAVMRLEDKVFGDARKRQSGTRSGISE